MQIKLEKQFGFHQIERKKDIIRVQSTGLYLYDTYGNLYSILFHFHVNFACYFKCNNDQQNKGAISKFRKNQLMEFLCRP